jgi:hypothetical protein
VSPPGPLSADARRFRDLVIDALWPRNDRRCVYIDEDRFLGVCAVCGYHVGVQFVGYAPRAMLECYGGCTEQEIAACIGLEARP